MKKNIRTIVLLSLLLTSCDTERCLDFYVQNDCNQYIVVNVFTKNFNAGQLQNMDILDTIYPNSKTHIFQFYRESPFVKGSIPGILKKMKITKNEKKTRYNPLDTSNWDLRQTEKYNYEATIIVKEDDFE